MTSRHIQSSGPLRVLEAYQKIVREIYRRDLKAGDKLPSQEVLRQEIGFSHATLSRAMDRLVADGVVARKTRLGTVVIDRDAVDLSAWTVALLVNWQERAPSPFYSYLVNTLQYGLVTAGCQVRLYYREHHTPGTTDAIANYQHLAEDLELGLVHGVMTSGDFDHADRQRLREAQIPVCFGTAWELAPCGSVIDGEAFSRQAVSMLNEKGITHFGLVTASYGPGYTGFYDGGELAASALPGAIFERLEVDTPGLPGGRRAAELLLARPEHERPKAIIVADDILALALTQTLQLQSDYAPELAVLTHQLDPLMFALPVLHFELNDGRLAEAAVDALLDRLQKPQLPDTIERIVPVPIQQEAAHLA